MPAAGGAAPGKINPASRYTTFFPEAWTWGVGQPIEWTQLHANAARILYNTAGTSDLDLSQLVYQEELGFGTDRPQRDIVANRSLLAIARRPLAYNHLKSTHLLHPIAALGKRDFGEGSKARHLHHSPKFIRPWHLVPHRRPSHDPPELAAKNPALHCNGQESAPKSTLAGLVDSRQPMASLQESTALSILRNHITTGVAKPRPGPLQRFRGLEPSL
ncbi:hypothetical protein EV356DRAFT_516310 [Viridothelium virens]|uniref:Uncharacterized protein n=1 Tax=Viridothelium virens TaxID=1048519 RepID=A0A6A6H6I3_VIRVR|nr:hypothetical protein EV356DRAFT_516310 [Viridothelium virens]